MAAQEDIMNIPTDKQKAIDAAMVQIERQFGKGSIMKLGSKVVLDVPVMVSSSPASRYKSNHLRLARLAMKLPSIELSGFGKSNIHNAIGIGVSDSR